MPVTLQPGARQLAQATALLRAAGIEHPAREARWLAAHVLATPPADPARLDALVARRAAHEPLAYLLGTAPFRALMLAVSPATLIPRADSETLIEAALAACTRHDPPRRVLDLGTGTGCLLLAALAEFPHAWGLGTDRSLLACRLAAANAAATGLAARAAFLCADWAAPIAARFDLVLANPPYIPTADIPGLMPEIAWHEPLLALDGGADGLDAYRSLIAALPPLMAPAGIAIFELGAGQAAPVASLAAAAGWAAAFRRDGGGHERALILTRR